MKGLIAQAVSNRRITVFCTVAAALYGLYAYAALPKQESPDVSVPVAMITTIYPGAAPVTVERLVTEPIEDAASRINGFDTVRSYSRDSVSIVGVRLRQGVDIAAAWQELEDEIDDVAADLPKGCRAPSIRTDLDETAGMIIALSGASYSYDQLTGFARVFKKRLGTVPGIGRFDISGEIEKRIEVIVELDKLSQHGFSLEDMTRILGAQNVEIPSGRLEKGRFKINVSTPGVFESARDIENVIIDVSRESGAPVRLRDVARVEVALESDTYRIRQDGDRAVLLTGYFQPDKNVVAVGEEVRGIIEDVKGGFPSDLSAHEVIFQPKDVSRATADFMGSLVQGIVLVVLVVFIGMGLRNAIIVSSVIPISVLLTFGVMWLIGVKVHQVSVAALVIALGMLVDNAIVVADAVQVRIDDGMDRVKAAVEGARESAMPILTSTLTTVAAFSPLLVLPGMAGQFLESIPIIVIVALTASYAVAIVATPAMAAAFFRPLKTVRYREGAVRGAFSKLLEFALVRPKRTLAVAGALLMASLGLISLLDVRFFPYADKPIAYIDVNVEISDLDAVEEVVAEIEELLKEQVEVTHVTSAIGDGLPKFYITLPTAIQSRSFGQVFFEFDLERGARFENNQELAAHLQKAIDARLVRGQASVKLLQQGEPVRAPVVVRLSGEDTDKLEKAASALASEMRKVPGAVNVADDVPRRSFELRVDVDDDLAGSMGVSKYDIQRQISIALHGSPASVFRKGGREYDIVLKSDIDSPEKLGNLGIKSSIAGNKVLVKQFAEVSLRDRLETIIHYQKERSVAVVADVAPGTGAAVLADRIESDILPRIDLAGVDAIFDGEREKIQKNFGNVGYSALFALAAVYIILLFQFGSFSKPLVILVTVPLSIVGSVIGLLVFWQPLSFTALLGVASLIGIVVNNAILLMEFVGKGLSQGLNVDGACRDAVSRRFRPILLSTITTVAGLIPLALSGSAMFTPMAVALMTGLLGSTLLTLIVIPVVYRQTQRVSLRRSRQREACDLAHLPVGHSV